MRIHPFRALALLAAGAMSFSAVSCGGGGSSPPMVLVGFNLPNIAGVTLNQPLIFTFSDDLNPATVTPDTVQVVGTPSFNFERIVIDGNLAAMLPRVPNFEDYSDSGLAPATTYSVFMPVLPAVDTVRSITGRPLVHAEPFNFTTLPVPSFIEPRRAIVYSPGPPAGMGDDDGCINNADNEFFQVTPPSVFQFATDADARLLCLKNEGAPRILGTQCTPFHDQRGIGTPSASAPGTLDLGAIRLIFNEPLDPVSVVPYVPTTKFSINVQLWLVGDTDANPTTPVQVQTNKPLVVQDLSHTEVILVASGPVQQGTYLVNVQGVKDLPGNLLKTDDDKRLAPPFYVGGYNTTNLTGKVPPGYRLFFRTLALPATNGSFTEAFSSSFNEGTGDTVGAGHGTQTFSRTLVNDLNNPIPGAVLPQPGVVLTAAQPGQSTTANWNGGFNFLGLPGIPVNYNMDDGSGRLKAVFQPYLGNAVDGDANGNIVFTGANNQMHFEPDLGHPNGRVWEFNNLTIDPGATLTLFGDRPAMILCRGAFVNNGTIQASGATGRYGMDSGVVTGSPLMWTHALTPRIGGPGGVGGPGGGTGGQGSPKVTLPTGGDAANGGGGVNVFNFYDAVANPPLGFGLFGTSADATNKGGGGGGFGTAGTAGSPSGANAGSAFGAADFNRALAQFVPDRCFMPNSGITGGGGGGGGGGDDDSISAGIESETGDGAISQAGADDGGGGGGGGGGALWVMADTITLGASSQILCNGGRGGNTYAFAQQSVLDPDGMAATGDEYVVGLSVPDTTAGTGQGAGGGGGSGGAILLQSRGAMLINAGAQLRCVGGAGGTASGGKNGGAGGDGRIALVASILGGTYTNNTSAGNMTPTPGLTGAVWQPTIDTVSEGVSKWFDLTTPTADFKQPFYIDNFAELTGIPNSLVRGTDFDAFLEVQGADGPSLNPSQADATSGSGVTAWTAIAFTTPPAAPNPMTIIDNKRFVRYRWRFFVRNGYPEGPPFAGATPPAAPMPAILDFTLPFQK